MKKILSAIIFTAMSASLCAGEIYTPNQLKSMVNNGQFPEQEEINSTKTKTVLFTDCIDSVENIMSVLRDIYPVKTIAKTSIIYSVKAWTNDGVVLASCSKPDRKMIITKAKYKKASNTSVGGISLRFPEMVEEGGVVPVFITPVEPLLPGDILVLTGDKEIALEVKTDLHKITKVSTRLRLSDGIISAYILRNGKKISSVTENVTKIYYPANEPSLVGNKSIKVKKLIRNNEIKMLFMNDMPKQNYLKEVEIVTNKKGKITLSLTPRLSKSPYIGITTSDYISSVKVEGKI